MEGLVNPAFWRGRHVLITGHTGFKGAWLALWLQRLGASVTGFALDPPTEPSFFAQAGVSGGMASCIGDVRHLDSLADAFAASRPEVVFHLAAQPLVRAGYREPVETFATNVMGTVNLLECARRTGSVKAVVNVTSDKCYAPDRLARGYRESDPLGGVDPYSSSKACAEMVTEAYRRAYFAVGPAVATARSGNVIGGGDWGAERIVPDWARAAFSGRPLRLRSPEAVRPWQHVLDPLAGYLLLAERLHEEGTLFAEAWNFGPAEESPVTVHTLSEGMSALWRQAGGGGVTVEPDRGPHPHESPCLRLDSGKARGRLGWVPRLGFEDALRLTVAWYRAVLERPAELRAVSLRQIDEYLLPASAGRGAA